MLALDAPQGQVPLALATGTPLEDRESPMAPGQLRFLWTGSGALPLPKSFRVKSSGAAPLELGATETECPLALRARALRCSWSTPLRLTGWQDDVHPAAGRPSLFARLGERLEVHAGTAHGLATIAAPPSGAKRAVLYETQVRVSLVRATKGGKLPVGTDEASARQFVQEELERLDQAWAACGIRFRLAELEKLDPPPAALVSLGCGTPIAPTGGELTLRIGNLELRWKLRPDEAPLALGARMQRTLANRGFQVERWVLPPGLAHARPVVELFVRDREGRPVEVKVGTNDPSFRVCATGVNFDDGLTHFDDLDSIGGTREERSLLFAAIDREPRTLDVVIIPHFASGARMGESFIVGRGAPFENVVILDRGGLAAGARSSTLAHELGHVLLGMPEHPDDFGIDDPRLLMDADASDPSVFGPRRLDRTSCARALSQSGPGAPIPLLEEIELPFPPEARGPKSLNAAGAAPSATPKERGTREPAFSAAPPPSARRNPDTPQRTDKTR